MNWTTIDAGRATNASDRQAIDEAAHACGGSVEWVSSQRAGRTWGVAALPDVAGSARVAAVARACGLRAFDAAVIVLAVFPAVPEALPPLLQALGGAGRPAGVVACEPCDGGGATIAWEIERTPAALVLGLVDLELARFASGRTCELLTPLPEAWAARLAADGLRAPELAPDRILETLIRAAGLP